MSEKDQRLTYRAAGVDIEAGESFVELIKPLAAETFDSHVLSGIGGFGAGYLLPAGYREPVLVSATDGVGTKLMVAQMAGIHHTVGIDLVAMCVNDIVTTGAKPLFFLDYFASGKLSGEVAVEVVKGIVKGCKLAGCCLIGGETAEMPGFYTGNAYELAGFAVGVVEKSRFITGRSIREGDVVVGLASSGFHSNGFSLLRKLFFEVLKLNLSDEVEELNGRVCDVLLEPTRIYVSSVLSLLDRVDVKGVAHITGGGIPGNLARILPEGVDAVVETGSWEVPSIFRFVMERGKVAREEMFRTFNMGIGMCLVVSPEDVEKVQELLSGREKVYVIGKVVKGSGKVILRGVS